MALPSYCRGAFGLPYIGIIEKIFVFLIYIYVYICCCNDLCLIDIYCVQFYIPLVQPMDVSDAMCSKMPYFDTAQQDTFFKCLYFTNITNQIPCQTYFSMSSTHTLSNIFQINFAIMTVISKIVLVYKLYSKQSIYNFQKLLKVIIS